MENQNIRIINIDGVDTQFIVDEHLQPTLLRALTGKTPTDEQVDSLPLPEKPVWLRLIVKGLKVYRVKISHRLGQRCVYEPSCSRYSELAFRKHGLLNGLELTAKRLHRCRPGNGGIDIP